jgi:hypothetical protein
LDGRDERRGAVLPAGVFAFVFVFAFAFAPSFFPFGAFFPP